MTYFVCRQSHLLNLHEMQHKGLAPTLMNGYLCEPKFHNLLKPCIWKSYFVDGFLFIYITACILFLKLCRSPYFFAICHSY